ncbi:MAG TPA: sialate O-acetylesterase [Ruminiclostridium sp.]
MKIGALIENGPMDWQIIQQVNGKTDIYLAGSWASEEESSQLKVFVRIVREDTGAVVIPWQTCEELEERKWKTTIRDVPSGGLYRIESCLTRSDNNAIEWNTRGDMIHHVGVGDLYVIAGQSNSAGYGKDFIFDPPEIGIHLLKNSGKWDLASHPMNESTGTIHEDNREGANPGHSPYLSFARQLKRELGYPIGLVQAALGGSPLSAWNPEEDGILYRNMMNIINSQGNMIKGILWYQGCSDTTEGLSDSYLDRFESMVSHLRGELKDVNLPILTVQLNRMVSPSTEIADRCWGKVREAQRQAANKINKVFVVPSTDCALSDFIHNSSSANLVLGERLAGIALRHIYGRSTGFQAPDLAEARKVDKDRISLIFNHVNNRLYTFEVSADALAISVQDDDGFAQIRSYEIENENTLTITLDRELKGRCQVHGAYEQNPKHAVPIDYASHIPILSFYGVYVLERL